MKDKKKPKSSTSDIDKGFSLSGKPNIDKGFSLPSKPNIDKGFSLPSKPASKKVKTPTMKSGGKIATPMKGMKTSKSKPCK